MQEQVIKLRPNAANGLWLGVVLPVALALSFIKYNNEASQLYHQCFLFSLGILYTTVLFINKYKESRNTHINTKSLILPAIIVSITFLIILNKGVLLCCYSGILSTLIFHRIYIFVLKTFPLSFTLGEALLCSQGFVIFFYSITINLHYAGKITPKTYLEISTLIIQMGLSSIILICFLVYKYPWFRPAKRFYPISAIVIVFVLFIPLQILLKQNPLMWLFNLIRKDSNMIIFVYWAICCVCAMYAVFRQIQGAKKASSVSRKSFHVLIVLVFLPGIIYNCSIIYLASGVVLGIFVTLELLRNLNIPPLGTMLQDGFAVFSDEKDLGPVALTPIYLLVGCSLPLWIHPAPCDVTDSAGFNLLPLISGLLSVGIGDTLASYVGTTCGKHKWSGSQKTVEGTIACILGQISVIYLLCILGEYSLQQHDIVKISIAVITVALVEAKTTQVDNLVLPLIMYSILL